MALLLSTILVIFRSLHVTVRTPKFYRFPMWTAWESCRLLPWCPYTLWKFAFWWNWRFDIMDNHNSCYMHPCIWSPKYVKLPYSSTNIKLYSLLYPDNQDFNHAVDLVTYYRQSEEYQHVQEQLQPLLDDLTEREMTEGFTVKSNRAAYATNFFWQVLTFAIRFHSTYILLCTCKSLQNKIDISCISKN